jgi:hypothetical protein
MIHPNSGSPIRELVKRSRDIPFFMAYVLARYQDQEGLSDEDLANLLGTLPDLVCRLAMCRKPEADSANFAESVRQIADYTLVDESLLANIIRQVSGLEALSKFSQQKLLSAARDRGDADPDEQSSPSIEKPEGES